MNKKNKTLTKKTNTSNKIVPVVNANVKQEATPPVAQTESWLENAVKLNYKWIILVLALVYAGSRFTFFSNFKDHILYEQYLGPETDNYFFLEWSKKLPMDWLQNQPVHPYHFWHKDFAKDYFNRHPEEFVKYSKLAKASPDSLLAGQLLWNKWYKEKVFHQEPLYPYLLAFFVALDIDPVQTMLILQLLLGISSGILLMLITRSYFGFTASFYAGLIYCFCGILLYNEIILLRTSWSVFLTILLVYVLDQIIKLNTPRVYLIAGLIFGLSYVMQSTFVLFLFVACAIGFFLNKTDRKSMLMKLGMCLLGFLLFISPLLVRNVYTGCPLFSMSSVGPVTFIVPNAHPSISYASWYPQAAQHTPLLEQGYTGMREAIKITLSTHTGLDSFFELIYNKLRMIWLGYEYPNNENFYLYKEHFSIFSYFLLDFFIIAPLAIAGLIIALYKRKTAYPLYFAILFHLAIMLGFYVLARFRAPLVIVAIPFAAYLVSEMTSISRKHLKYAAGLITLTGFFIYLSFKNYSKAQEDQFLSGNAYRGVYMISLEKKLNYLSKHNKWNEWLKTQEKIFSLEPEFIRNIANEAARTGAERVSIASFFAEMHQKRKDILEKAGMVAALEKEEKMISNLNNFIMNSIAVMEKYGVNMADQTESVRTYANTCYTQKKYMEAQDAYKKILSLNPNDADALNKMGLCYLERGSYDSSKIYFNQILSMDAKNTNALLGMAGALFFTKRYRAAISHTRRAVELIPADGQLYANIAACYMNVGKIDSAFIWLRKGVKIKPTPRTYEYLSSCFQAIGKKDSAQIMLQKSKE